MKLEFNSFGGIMPRYADKMLPDDAATQAVNVELLGGKIVPLSGLTLPVDNEGVYRVKGPIVNDEHDRYYSTDGVSPLAVENGATAVAKIAEPVAPVGERLKAFNEVVNNSIKCFCRPAVGIEEEMTLLEILDGEDDESKKVRFRYEGMISEDPIAMAFIDSYYKMHLQIPIYGDDEESDSSSASYSSSNSSSTSNSVSGSGSVSASASASELSTITYSTKHLPDSFSNNPADGTNIEHRNRKNDLIGRIYIESYKRYASVTPDGAAGASYVLNGHDIEFVVRIKYIDTKKDHYYLYRYVDTQGLEGPPSELSAMITRYPGEFIKLTNIPTSETGMSKVRIYRSAGVEQAAGFYFVGEADLGASEFIDDLDDADLAEKMPSYGNPPDGMDNLTLMSGGILAANKGKDIYFSEPYLPHVFPSSYAVNVDHNIVAMASRRNSLVVMTDVKLCMFSGNDPKSIIPVEIAFSQPCLSRQGVVKINDDVFYPSPDGLVRVGNSGFGIITGKAFRKQDWAALKPETWIAKEYNNKYMAMNEDGLSVIIDVSERIITTYTNGSGAVWQSKIFCLSKLTAFTYIKLVAENYPVTVDFISGGSTAVQLAVTSSVPRRIPVLRRESEWQIKITSQYRVDSLVLATSGAEI